MAWFRFREDRLPIAVILCLFAFDLFVYAYVDSTVWLAVWTVIGILPKGHVCAWNHHHQHVNVFRHAALNRALEIVYALQTGITSNAWVLHHSLGHHVHYLDQAKDESRWQRADGTQMGELEYSLEVAATAYPRALEVGARHPKQRRVFVGMAAVTVAILAALFAARPAAALFVFLIPMAISLFITAWATYSHHAGKSTESHFVACNNILHRGYNALTGNLGYHTAHHYKPGVHWSRLPELHASIAHKIPADCYLTPGLPWCLGQSAVEEAPTA
jgi:fatty acid desaturase